MKLEESSGAWQGGGHTVVRASPLSATLLMSTPCSAAMKPSTEKTTNPEKKLVLLLIRARMKASLKGKRESD